MKHRKCHRAAALVLAVVMALGLAACGGSGSQSQSGGQSASNSADNSAWYGLWSNEDVILEIRSTYAKLHHLAEPMVIERTYSCGYLIDGNTMHLDINSDDEVLRMDLTLDSDQLVAGGETVYTRLSDDPDSIKDYQLAATGSEITATEPVLTEPVVTNPPAASTGITGIWWDGPSVLVFHNDYALSYVFGSGDDGDLRFGYLKHLNDCSYTLSGNALSLSLYEMDGTLVNSVEVTLDGNTLSNDQGSMVKVSNNTGTEGDLNGIWHCMGDEFQFGALKGNQLQFNNDGTYTMSLEDGSDQKGGSYMLTSQYDLPAVTLCDQNGNVIGTYCYEFLENDLLMIYVYDIDLGGYVFYRAS